MSGVALYLDTNQLYTGQNISGKIVCNFRSRKEVRKIRVKLKGVEHTSWTKSQSYYDSNAKKHRHRTIHCSGDNNIIRQEKDVVQTSGFMEPGQYTFPFSFLLPDHLPGSYNCSYGYIKYHVKVTVDRPMALDYEDKKEFQLTAPIRLANLPGILQQPIKLEDEKTVCCFCCASGPVEFEVDLEKRAFVVGEDVRVKIFCNNMSSANVEGINVEIKMKMTYTCISPSRDTKHDSELVATSYNSGIEAHGHKTYNLVLTIPPSTVVPNFSGCELFSCDSVLKATAIVNGCHTNLDVSTDIALGNVPYAPFISPPPPGIQLNSSYPVIPGEASIAMPMPMPMPMSYLPGQGPSAPVESQLPSAPPNFDIATATSQPENEKSPPYESPPPTYDEVAKQFEFSKK